MQLIFQQKDCSLDLNEFKLSNKEEYEIVFVVVFILFG